MNLSETDRAYIAGYYDGEGTITIGFSSKQCSLNSKRYWYPRAQLVIVSKNKSILDEIQSLFELGHVYMREGPTPPHNLIGSYRISIRRDILKFIDAIEPYLKEKKDAVENVKQCLIYMEQIKLQGHKWAPEQIVKMKEYMEKSRLLKMRDCSSPDAIGKGNKPKYARPSAYTLNY